MEKITQGLTARYRDFFSNSTSLISASIGIIFLLGSLVVNYFANQYAYIKISNSVTDILLDNLPVVRMDDAFVAGTIIFLVFVVFLLVAQPQKISFVLKTIAFFVITRSLFITMTHLGPSPLNTLTAPSEIGRVFTSGADLFFSGHTGLPFLFSLMYWYNKWLRWLFIVVSVVAAAGVLLGHIHYSIDIASAYFITYGIYIIAAEHLFKKDFEIFQK